MCGIAGQVTADRRPVDGAMVTRMGARLRHRGPDGSGVCLRGHVGLAHQRLSVLDLSEAGSQPMSNERGTIWAVLNGEIYNFEELRASLRRPRAFRSRTDTEVLVALYEDYGLSCLSMLKGMYAFAIWDEPAQRLILARDRLGKKPLVYAVTEQGLTFASELKALLEAGLGDQLDPVAIHHYLTFQYVPAPMTVFRNIRKLKPGHVLVYENGKAVESAYWTLSYTPKVTPQSEEEAREEFERLLRDAVRLRLVSDVPIGAFLSGGLDSSTVVACMAELMQEPVKTFSIGFREDAFSELPYAREVAERFSTAHHEFVVEPSAMEVLPDLVRAYDEPYADASAIPTYFLARLSRQFVTVVLSGDGGDELFAGYPRYGQRWWDSMKARLPALNDRRGPTWHARVSAWERRWPGPLGRLVGRLLYPFSHTYFRRISYFDSAEKDALYTPDFREVLRGHDSYALLAQWFEEIEAEEPLDRLLGLDTRTYLPDDLLVKLDRATMAHGLEARSPFLDHRLVEFVAALPSSFKVRDGESKYLVKAAMRERLPERVWSRPKQGFAVPLDQWFRREARQFLRDVLLSPRALERGYFRPDRVRRLVEDHQTKGKNLGHKLYALLMLELWHQAYADRS